MILHLLESGEGEPEGDLDLNDVDAGTCVIEVLKVHSQAMPLIRIV
jgi:hypothetical protein